MQRQDFIERLIQQLAAAIAHALGIARAGRTAEALDELHDAWSKALGLSRDDAVRLDPATLRSLLGSKRELAATLFDSEAKVHELRGDLAAAADARRLAATLRAP
jgi:hypothetical protein